MVGSNRLKPAGVGSPSKRTAGGQSCSNTDHIVFWTNTGGRAIARNVDSMNGRPLQEDRRGRLLLHDRNRLMMCEVFWYVAERYLDVSNPTSCETWRLLDSFIFHDLSRAQAFLRFLLIGGWWLAHSIALGVVTSLRHASTLQSPIS